MDVDLLLVPYDTALRGWRMGAGPERLVAAGLLSRLEALGHTVRGAARSPRGAGADFAGRTARPSEQPAHSAEQAARPALYEA